MTAHPPWAIQARRISTEGITLDKALTVCVEDAVRNAPDGCWAMRVGNGWVEWYWPWAPPTPL